MKFCVDCDYYLPPVERPPVRVFLFFKRPVAATEARCSETRFVTPARYDPVSGELKYPEERTFLRCEFNRAANGYCKPEGVLFSAKKDIN